jgi:5'-nucleotidase
MRLLLTNDDGIMAPGIQALAQACQAYGHQVWVVAPRQECSTCGHSMTLNRPIEVKAIQKNWWAVDGFPADCVLWAAHYLGKKQKFDLLLSGINRGANLAQDLYYSGTVAAAREGMQLGLPSIALSLAVSFAQMFGRAPKRKLSGTEYFQDVATWVAAFLSKSVAQKDFAGCFLNLNFPNCPATQYQGVQVGRPGLIDYDKKITPCPPLRHKHFFWIGGAQCWPQDRPGTDVRAIKNNFIAASWVKLDAALAENPKAGRASEKIWQKMFTKKVGHSLQGRI